VHFVMTEVGDIRTVFSRNYPHSIKPKHITISINSLLVRVKDFLT